MRVIDSPGVVFDEDDYDNGKGTKKGNVLLRNVIKVEDVEDPISIGMSLGAAEFFDNALMLFFF